jgi:hypothetical protein
LPRLTCVGVGASPTIHPEQPSKQKQVVLLDLLGNTSSGNCDCVASCPGRIGHGDNRLDQGFHLLIRKRHRWGPYYSSGVLLRYYNY